MSRYFLAGIPFVFAVLGSCSSSDVELKRLQQMEASMRLANKRLWQGTEAPTQSIEFYYHYNGKPTEDSILFQLAKGLRTHTAGVLSTIDSVRRELLNATGNAKQLENLNSEHQVQQAMVGKGGAAFALQRRLNGYVAYLHDTNSAGRNTDSLLRTPARLEQEYTRTPVVAALAQLTRQETEVLLLAQEAMDRYSMKSGTNVDPFYITVANAVAEIRTVLPGSRYRAKLFLTHVYKRDIIRAMTVNGATVPMDAQNRGVVSFVVPTTALGGADSVTAFWDGSITTMTGGGDRTYTIRVPYTILKSPCK